MEGDATEPEDPPVAWLRKLLSDTEYPVPEDKALAHAAAGLRRELGVEALTAEALDKKLGNAWRVRHLKKPKSGRYKKPLVALLNWAKISRRPYGNAGQGQPPSVHVGAATKYIVPVSSMEFPEIPRARPKDSGKGGTL